MRFPRSTIFAAVLLLALIAAVGCDDDTAGPTTNGEAVPDFALVDENATSATGGTAVSPRDHLQRVSAWYFSHAT